MLKSKSKAVTYNDYLKFNCLCAKAIIENHDKVLTESKAKNLIETRLTHNYVNTISDNYHDIFYLDEENKWLDVVSQNVAQMEDRFEQAIAYYALFQSCIIKRPYNLFHRKNLYMRTAEVERSFGNKTSWDRPFHEYFLYFVKEANSSIFDSGIQCTVKNQDALDSPAGYDLVYMDPPYLNANGVGVNYSDFYSFLEGISNYETWNSNINHHKKHKPFIGPKSQWNSEKTNLQAFRDLIHTHRNSIIVISYRSDGVPTENQLVNALKEVKKNVRTIHFGEYKYVLSTNSRSKELLIIAE